MTDDRIEQGSSHMTPEEDQLRYRLAVAEDFIGYRGYTRCTSPACNCGTWHGGFAEQRLDEIDDYLRGCGIWEGTILDSIKSVFRACGLDREETAPNEETVGEQAHPHKCQKILYWLPAEGPAA